MISQNIDLTLHRDFSTASRSPLDFHQIGQFYNNLSDIDSLFMRVDEYEAIQRYEKMFGKRRHQNEKYIVFGYESKHEAYWKITCARCGKPLRVPWKIYGNVCEDCDCELESHRVPWKKYYIPNENTHNDLFALR